METLKEVFVKERIDVDETHRNITLPSGVVGKEGMEILEPEAGLLNHINLDSPEAREMYKIVEIEIESRDDVDKAREIDSLTYSSQRHRQGSRRLLEDILVSWDAYQL
ncbi:hypothetical protein Tco_1497339, partial [Tanacetum coccineum]